MAKKTSKAKKITAGKRKFFYPHCIRTHATLVLRHESFDPNDVTKILKIRPDETQRVGVSIGWSKFPQRKANCSTWKLQTRNRSRLVNINKISEHIKWLLFKLKNKKNRLVKLKKRGWDIEIWFLCQIGSAKLNIFPTGGFILDEGIIEELSKYPIALICDVYADC